MTVHAATLPFLRAAGGKSDSAECPSVAAMSISSPSERRNPFTTWLTNTTEHPYAAAKSLSPYPACQIMIAAGVLFFVGLMAKCLTFIDMMIVHRSEFCQ